MVSSVGETPAVSPRNLGHNSFCQAVGGHELGSIALQSRQAGLPRGADESHSGQVHAQDRFALTGQSTLPALLQLAQPWPRQPPFELERNCPWLVMNRDSEHLTPPSSLDCCSEEEPTVKNPLGTPW